MSQHEHYFDAHTFPSQLVQSLRHSFEYIVFDEGYRTGYILLCQMSSVGGTRTWPINNKQTETMKFENRMVTIERIRKEKS